MTIPDLAVWAVEVTERREEENTMPDVDTAVIWEWADDGPNAVASFNRGYTPQGVSVRGNAERFADRWSMWTVRPVWITTR